MTTSCGWGAEEPGNYSHYLNGLYGNDTIWGSSRYENLINEAGASLLYGADGNDTLLAGEGDDTLDGGSGNDTLQGEAGNDTYLFRRGSGIDRINGWAPGDKIWLAATPGQTTLKRSNNDLVIGFTDTADKLVIENYALAAANSGNIITFRDGSTWHAADMDAWLADPARVGAGMDILIGGPTADAMNGYAGNDQISGNEGNDVIEGGLGNDLLIGAADYDAYRDRLVPTPRANGDDRYAFRRGDGKDIIADLDPTANTDTLRLIGIASEELALSVTNERQEWTGRGGAIVADIVLDLGQGDSITLQGAISRNGAAPGKIERIEFAASADAEPDAVWTDADLRARLFAGGAGDDLRVGWSEADRIDGGAGDDLLNGGDGDDTLLGGEGRDQLYGGVGDDLLIGGREQLPQAIDMTSSAANGNDRYLFGRGHGQDVVIDRDRAADNTDRIELAADILPAQVSLAHIGNDLVLSLTDAPDTLTVRNWFKDGSREWRVEQIAFAPPAGSGQAGTLWDEEWIKHQLQARGAANAWARNDAKFRWAV